tara:strand:+ start:65 stop:1258 length:1194 start_codon:yes stop_codon:yes gene_type:complete
MYWVFIGVSIAFILPITLFLVLAICRKVNEKEAEQNIEISFLKDQLMQINRDINNGITSDSDQFNKLSISRNILKIYKNEQKEQNLISAPTRVTKWVSVLVIAICLGGTHLTYLLTTDNYFKHQIFSQKADELINFKPNRPSQEVIEEFVEQQKNELENNAVNLESNSLETLVQELKTVLTQRQDDLVGHKLLVKHSTRLGDFISARKAQKKVLAILNDKANSSDFSEYGELCVIAASGYVSPEAANALMKSISLDTKNIQGNFYIGLLLLQENDSLQALKTWTHLLELKPSSSQYIPMLALEMKRLSSKFKLEFAETQQLSSNQLNIKTVFLQTLETLQRYLEKNGGKLEIWTMLISSYANLDFKEKTRTNIERVKSQFFLSDSQLQELKNNVWQE